MLLARQYNLFPQFFASNPSGMDLLQADYTLLARLAEAEAKAHEASRKRQEDAREHPGMERFSTDEEFWDEVAREEG